MSLVDQRLEQIGFVRELIIKRRFGNARCIHDFLHRRGGISTLGKAFERGLQKLLPRCGVRMIERFSHDLPNGR